MLRLHRIQYCLFICMVLCMRACKNYLSICIMSRMLMDAMLMDAFGSASWSSE